MHTDRDIYEVRDLLPVNRVFTYEHHGRRDQVQLPLGTYWPESHVRIHPEGSNVEVRGTFSTTGRLRELEFVTVTDRAEVTTADLRMTAVIRALREWHKVGQEITSQVLSGVPVERTVIDAASPTEALRMLSNTARPRAQERLRGPAQEELLREVAAAYKEITAQVPPDPKPRVTLALRFGYSPAHIGRLLMQARRPRHGLPPLLGPAQPGKAGESLSDEDGPRPGSVQPSPFIDKDGSE